jgi:myo-inositol-1(or 4)-monophosphatase
MKKPGLRRALDAATGAARLAGELLRQNLRRPKRINESSQHDIKLELDVRCQRLIARELRKALPHAALLGEEGTTGDIQSPWRWVVDPIDGTVNFTYGIPHACVSIALQEAREPGRSPLDAAYGDGYLTRLGVIYDPFTDELWTATSDAVSRLNGRRIRVAERRRLDESVVALGFAKHRRSLERMLPVFHELVHRVRKIRITGSAALSLVYVATGRFDGYVESGVRLWDIAAGGLIIQQAGGVFWRREIQVGEGFEIVVSAEPLQRVLHRMNKAVNV